MDWTSSAVALAATPETPRLEVHGGEDVGGSAHVHGRALPPRQQHGHVHVAHARPRPVPAQRPPVEPAPSSRDVSECR